MIHRPHILRLMFLGSRCLGWGDSGGTERLHPAAITPVPFALGTLPCSMQKAPGLEIIRVCFSLSSGVLQNGMLLLELGFLAPHPHSPLNRGGEQELDSLI